MRRISIVWLLALLAACAVNPGPGPGPGPGPTRDAKVIVTVVDQATHARVPGPAVAFDGAAPLTGNAFGVVETRQPHGTHEVCASAERYARACQSLTVSRDVRIDLRLASSRPPLSRVRAEGRFFVTDAGTYRGRWTSALAVLSVSQAERAAVLDAAVATGFDGVRVFAGSLGWAGQTPSSALAALPDLLVAASTRGLYVHLVAVTDSASGYDVEDHLRQVAELCEASVGCVLEAANELGHPTQSALVNDIRRFEEVAQRVIPAGLTWTLGAMLGQDEPSAEGYPPNGAAPFNTAHLDRGRDKWNQVRRVREIMGISELTGKPAISGEPIGAGEVTQPGRRESDPAFFFAYGALCRIFELAACVFHSEDGLFARPLGPVQQQCAEAFVAGMTVVPTDVRLGYRNAGWTNGDAPVKSFTNAVRVYAGVTGNEGYVVVVGDDGVQVEWQHGYRVVAELARRPGVIVWKVAR